MKIDIRRISVTDNPTIAHIVRSTLAEFGANHPGTVYYDSSTDALFELFQQRGAGYFIAATAEKILGGGGIFPTEGLPEGTCELVKMYLIPEARGLGLGRTIIEKCLAFAGELGYSRVYLESMPELRQALSVYEKFGFEYLKAPMGNSGHSGCSLWMLKNISPEPTAPHTPG